MIFIIVLEKFQFFFFTLLLLWWGLIPPPPPLKLFIFVHTFNLLYVRYASIYS
jgi:hypothetical protein